MSRLRTLACHVPKVVLTATLSVGIASVSTSSSCRLWGDQTTGSVPRTVDDRALNAKESAPGQQDPAPGQQDPPLSQQDWEQRGWHAIRDVCLDCHGEPPQEAGLDLRVLESAQNLALHPQLLERVSQAVGHGIMPPDDDESLTGQQRSSLIDALDETLLSIACSTERESGGTTVRRLNRAEYNRTVRDLFGIDLRPAETFVSDEVGAGFDNNREVLSLSPLQMEKYLDAAEEVSTRVLIDPATFPRADTRLGPDYTFVLGPAKIGRNRSWFMIPGALCWIDFEVPFDGDYTLRVSAGNARRGEPPTTIGVFDEDGLLLAKETLGFFSGGDGKNLLRTSLTLKTGSHRLFLRSLDDEAEATVGESVDHWIRDLPPSLRESTVEGHERRVLQAYKVDETVYRFVLRRVHLSGPQEFPEDLFPPSQKLIVRREAKRRGSKWQGVEEAAIECLTPLMERAFREPITAEEVLPYAELVSASTERGESFHRGLQIAISAILVSPRFLFRVEAPTEVPADPEPEPLEPYKTATRLSYFLWSSTPDEQLMSRAAEGPWTTSDLQNQARRMIEDPRSDSLGSEFASQWLGLRILDSHEVDEDQFPTFTPELREAMTQETQLLFMDLLRRNRPVAELLTADHTFINAPLARHYGLSEEVGDGFQKVSLGEMPRRGILGHAGILTLTSNPGRTSPVKRGKWILESILGTPPPDPPPGVPELAETAVENPNASLREQLELHRSDPTCASCHRLMDQLGFGLEQFDPVGQVRAADIAGEIDASGQLPDGRQFQGAVELGELLGASEKKAFARNVARRLLTFALGRELELADRCAIENIVENTSAQDYRLLDMIVEVVTSEPFQIRRDARIETPPTVDDTLNDAEP